MEPFCARAGHPVWRQVRPCHPRARAPSTHRRASLAPRRRFWTLLAIVAALHMANVYKDANKQKELDLPVGAVRRLPDGGLLMADGAIRRDLDDEGSDKGHRLHRVKEVGENEVRRASPSASPHPPAHASRTLRTLPRASFLPPRADLPARLDVCSSCSTDCIGRFVGATDEPPELAMRPL